MHDGESLVRFNELNQNNRIMNRLTRFVLLVWVALAGILKADAQPVTTIYSFLQGPANPRAGLTLGNDGNFYGTTERGGPNNAGTVFRVTTNGIITTLVNFDGYRNGAWPTANLTLGPDGNFYGTTRGGGTTITGFNTSGTVFRMTTNGILTILVNFNGTNGGSPQAGLALEPDGNFYGATEYGGLNGHGTVFKMTTNGTLTTLFNFDGTNGANLASLTAGPGGSLYGTTRTGGTNGNYGTVFTVTTNGTFTTLLQFGGTNGARLYGGVTVGPDGNLYGTTSFGVYSDAMGGSIFKLTTNGLLTTLIRFADFGGTNGQYPYAGLTVGPDDNFYGTTYGGGAHGNGTVFQVTTNGTLAMLTHAGIPFQTATNYSYNGYVLYTTNNWATSAKVFNGTLTTLFSFSALTNAINADGAQPQAALTLGPDGNFYGTTYGGGTNGFGTAFKVTTNGTFTTLASFSGNNGYGPRGALTPGPNGSLYGTANAGGISGFGTVFKITTAGALTTLVNFDRANDGANPRSGLIPGPGGNFYGTTANGGYLSVGSIFKLTTNGIFTALAYFNGTNGATPYGGLAVGTDGNLYGTTTYGGISNVGTIFQVRTNGTLTALANFTGANGAYPWASLTLGSDGNFYGTCETGGASNVGTVFQVTTSGTLTTLVHFNGTNGANPLAGLLLGSDGNFYGTTSFGGALNRGTVFKVTTGGTLTTLVNFAYTNGGSPEAALALGPDGNFYGTTGTGRSGAGTVFKLATNGTLTTLYSFVYGSTSPNGNYPSGLTLTTNGNFIHFYGTTYNGGSGGGGTVFQLNLTTAYAVAENSTNTFYPLTDEVVWAAGGVLGLVNAGATNGTAQIMGTGIVFTPAANFTGTATLSYTVTDNAGGTNYSQITVLVTNMPPVANPDFYTVAENSSANVLSPLANDVPITSGGVLSLVSVSPTNGTAVISGTNVLFTPQTNFTGTATIGYTITDNVGGTNSSLITVTVAVTNSISAVTITAPTPGQVVTNVLFTVTGTSPNDVWASGTALKSDVLVQLNNGSWFNPQDAGYGTNWIEPFILTPGSNTVQAYAVDIHGNVVSATNTVIFDYVPGGVSDLSVRASATPEPVAGGSNLVYTLTVSNAGPATATGVEISSLFPASAIVVSAPTSVFQSPQNGNVLLMNIGSLAVGATNSVQLVVQLTVNGKLTNVFEVLADQTDPVPANNFATVVSTITNAPPTGIPGTPYGKQCADAEIYFAEFAGIGAQLFPAIYSGGCDVGGTPTTAIPGDVVMLLAPAGGNYPTNWAAVMRFFNPSDPTGTNGLAATGVQAFFPAQFGSNGFASFKLFPNAAYYPGTPIAPGEISTVISEVGPNVTLAGGQIGFFVLTVSNSVAVSITSPVASQQMSNQVFTVTGTASAVGPVSNVWVQLNNGGWINPTTANGLTNWSAVETLTPGSNTVSAYAVDTTGNVSATNSVTFDYAPNVSAQADLQLSADYGSPALLLPLSHKPDLNWLYSLTVSNAGPSMATGVVVSNQIPTNVICGGNAYAVNVISATGGATPTNGVLLLNLGSLAPGATNLVQILESITPVGTSTLTTNGLVTNVFQVFANETDPVPNNNSATFLAPINLVTYTSSTANFTNSVSATANVQSNAYSTELIARLPNGTVVYDQIFNVAYSNATVQSAITTAAGDLTGAGATSFTGPTQTSFLQNLLGSSSVTATNPIGTAVTPVVTTYVGPQTIFVGTNQSVAYPLLAGTMDIDALQSTVVTNLVTTTITSNYLNSAVYAMTGVVAQVDVALSLTAAPNPVAVGAPLTYSLTVTNNSSTTATGVIVSNTLPPNVTLFSLLPSQGSATNQADLVTYFVGSLPNGSAATLAIVVLPNTAGLLTNTASAFSLQTDSQPTNNNVTNVTTAVNVPITNLVLTVLSAITLNPQTGLFEQRVQVANGGPATPSSVMILVSGLAANAHLYNATGITNGTPFVQSASPLGVGSTVVFLLEYYVPTRVAPTNLTLTVEAGPPVIPPVVSGTIFNISRTIVLADGSVLVEFSAVPGQVYAIQYSSDMVTWRTAVPAITAPANRVQWIDSGPPKTVSSPAQQGARYYRVVLLTAH